MVPRARGCVSGPNQGHLGNVYANFLGPILDTCQSSSVDMYITQQLCYLSAQPRSALMSGLPRPIVLYIGIYSIRIDESPYISRSKYSYMKLW